MTLPGVAVVVGAVAYVVAVEVGEQAILALGLEALGDHAVAGDAGAHAHARALGEGPRDVGLGARAAVLAEHHVVGVAGVLAAGVALDHAFAREPDVVAVPDEDTAALVVLSLVIDVASVAGDGAAVDGVVVVADVDAAALVLAGVASDRAVADGRVLLVELNAAAVVLRVVVRDGEALDSALVCARLLVDVDAASALVALGRGRAGALGPVAGYRALAIGGLDREAGHVAVDAAAGLGSRVVFDGRAVHEVDVGVLAIDVDAAAPLGRVIADLGVVERDLDALSTDADAAAVLT